MPHGPFSWSGTQFAEGFYTTELPPPQACPVRTFLPTGYEPNYPYPLVVFIHGDGGSDEQVLRLAPRLSRRNYICLGLRGPVEVGTQANGRPGFGWGSPGEFDIFAEEYLIRAVEQTRRTYHVHSERVYLAGIGAGASMAYRLGLSMPERVAGVIALNGCMPRSNGGPLFRLPDVRQLRVLIGHGTENELVPLTSARRDFLALYSAGVDVRLNTYETGHRLHPHMLRDVNRWIMGNLNAEFGSDEDEDAEID